MNRNGSLRFGDMSKQRGSHRRTAMTATKRRRQRRLCLCDVRGEKKQEKTQVFYTDVQQFTLSSSLSLCVCVCVSMATDGPANVCV